MEKHGFLTHHSPDEEDPWIAILPEEDDKGKTIGEIMSESCVLYEEEFGIGYGKTEDFAVIALALLKSIPLWNEEALSAS